MAKLFTIFHCTIHLVDLARLLTIRLIKFAFIITAVCLVPLLLIPTDVYVEIFNGEEFGEIKSVFLYLGIGTVMFSASAMLSAYLSGTGQFQVNTKASFIGLIATVVLGFWLIPTYEMLGAGLTASASYLITVFYQVTKVNNSNSVAFCSNMIAITTETTVIGLVKAWDRHFLNIIGGTAILRSPVQHLGLNTVGPGSTKRII